MGKGVKLGISACLLGHRVRYDGSDKKAGWLEDLQEHNITWVPFCPETGCGLGCPRDPIQIYVNKEVEKVCVIRTGEDMTDRLRTWADNYLKDLAAEKPAGIIFKSRSPSCGLTDTPRIAPDGSAAYDGPGLFAALVRERFPHLPAADETALADVRKRERFFEMIRTR